MTLPVNSIQMSNTSAMKNNNDLTYTKAHIDFIHTLGMRVIAGGIDTKEQLEVMKDLGCDYIQGDIIAPPLDDEDLIRFINENSQYLQ